MCCGSTMVSSVLWISAWMLASVCLLMPCSGYLVLREGEKCGAWIEGACEPGLLCLNDKPTFELFYAEGVCGRDPVCNCSEFQCPPAPRNCYGYQMTDPCGCCTRCGKRKGQVCGGPSWRYGYCDSQLVCALVVGLNSVRPPQIGVCKDVPSHLKDTFPSPICPVNYGCNVHVGTCDCYSEQTCVSSFSYSTYEACYKILEADRMYDPFDENQKPFISTYVCMEWSCEVQGCNCVCQNRKCDFRSPPLLEAACCNILKESGCQNASCPEDNTSPCPADSFISQPYIEPGQCCPVVPAVCTCDIQSCSPKPQYCHNGGFPKLVAQGNGHPGTCCDRYECVKEESPLRAD